MAEILFIGENESDARDKCDWEKFSEAIGMTDIWNLHEWMVPIQVANLR